MKKSNKLLLGGFLFGLLLITSIHITLYAKYKAGNFTINNAEDEKTPNSMQTFPNILFLMVRNVPYASVKFGDVAQVDKGEEDNLEFIQRGDTLLITGKPDANGAFSDNDVEFNLPNNATLSVTNSSISFRPGKKMAEINSVIHLQKAQAVFSGAKTPFLFGQFKITADSSAVLFHGSTQIKNLDVQLTKSAFEYAEGDFGQLFITADSVSRISLQSKHLVKANIKVIPSQ
ncbi:MAG: hypothetical protein V4676_07015 [Bacteroidota bacterium]